MNLITNWFSVQFSWSIFFWGYSICNGIFIVIDVPRYDYEKFHPLFHCHNFIPQLQSVYFEWDRKVCRPIYRFMLIINCIVAAKGQTIADRQHADNRLIHSWIQQVAFLSLSFTLLFHLHLSTLTRFNGA